MFWQKQEKQVFIGMPVFNGEAFIKQAIDCLIRQTFSAWKLLIADNCSEDRTFEICSGYAAIDSRITVIRHERNIGATNNFKFLLDQADGEYFMWAACDDYWAPGFIEKCVDFFEKSPETGMVFSNVFVFDHSGQRRLWKFDLSCLSSQVPRKAFFKFLFDYDRNGKPNLIYSIYRLDVVKKAFSKYPLENSWGSDMIFVAHAVRIKGLKVLDECLFGKRLIEKASENEKSIYDSLRKKLHFIPEYFGYLYRYFGACKNLWEFPFIFLANIWDLFLKLFVVKWFCRYSNCADQNVPVE